MIIKLYDTTNNPIWLNTDHIIYWKRRKGVGQGGTDGSYILCTNDVEMVVTDNPEILMSKIPN